jgi:hypothetical protein
MSQKAKVIGLLIGSAIGIVLAIAQLVIFVIVASGELDYSTNNDIKILTILELVIQPIILIYSTGSVIMGIIDILAGFNKEEKKTNTGVLCLKTLYLLAVIAICITCIVYAGKEYNFLAESGLGIAVLVFAFYFPLISFGLGVLFVPVAIVVSCYTIRRDAPSGLPV